MEFEMYPGTEFYDSFMEPEDEEQFERAELIRKLAVTMGLFDKVEAGDEVDEEAFISLLENACYLCNVELEDLSAQELSQLQEMAGY